MTVTVFYPAPATAWKGPIVLALPAFLIVGVLIADDRTERLIFLAFVGLFILLIWGVSKFLPKHSADPLLFDPDGITWPPFAELYGVERVPWSDIDRMDLFRSSGSTGGAVFSWLRLFLREGDVLEQIKRPLGEQLFGGDINVQLSFDAPPEKILETAKQFHQQFG